MLVILILALLAGQTQASAAADAYAPLRLYDGAWTVTIHDEAGKTSTDSLVNDCHLFGRYFACQQTVNGTVGALTVYIPGLAAGHYITQNILPDGRALGVGELTIEGSRWTFLGHETQDGRTLWQRVTNDFTGNDRIHWESGQSTDNKTWTITMSGDDVRSGAAKP
jgi:hypothetical protein